LAFDAEFSVAYLAVILCKIGGRNFVRSLSHVRKRGHGAPSGLLVRAKGKSNCRFFDSPSASLRVAQDDSLSGLGGRVKWIVKTALGLTFENFKVFAHVLAELADIPLVSATALEDL
jgi:hypothetical protein